MDGLAAVPTTRNNQMKHLCLHCLVEELRITAKTGQHFVIPIDGAHRFAGEEA
jgi:hypothetical protein